MDGDNIKLAMLSIFSLFVTFLAIVSEEYRILLASVFSVFLVAYFSSMIYSKVEENSKEVGKLNEKLKIYRDLINMKSNIKDLNRKVFKK